MRASVASVTDYTYEDAFITYRYAQNLVDGLGFVYTPGERVLGTTTPLYTIMLAILMKGGVDIFAAGRAINIVADGLAASLVTIIVVRYSRPWLAILAGSLYALSPPHVAWAVSGMETALFGFLSLLTLYSYMRKWLTVASLLAAIVILVRIDGLILAAVMFVHYLIRERRVPWREMACFAAALVPWFAFATAYFGTPIPQSLMAKAVVYSGHAASFLPNLTEILDKFWYRAGWSGRGLVLAFLVGVVASVLQARLRDILPLVAWFFAYYAAFILSRTHLHGWYLIPPLSIFIAVSTIGLGLIVGLVSKRTGLERPLARWEKGWSSAIILVVVVASLPPLLSRVEEMAEVQRYEEEVRKPVGLWLRDNTAEDAVVFLEPIGYIGFYSERYILDDTGLVSPQMLAFNTPPRTQLCAKLKRFHPAYVVFRQGDVESRPLCGPGDTFFETTYIEVTCFQPSFALSSMPPGEATLCVFALREPLSEHAL